MAFLIRSGWMVNGLVCRRFLFASVLYLPMTTTTTTTTNNNNNNNNHTHARPNRYVNKMVQCCGIKGYTQTEKLQPVSQI